MSDKEDRRCDNCRIVFQDKRELHEHEPDCKQRHPKHPRHSGGEAY